MTAIPSGGKHPASRLQERKGRQFAELATVFDPLAHFSGKQWYPGIAVSGVHNTDGRRAVVLETVPGSKATERLFIDRQFRAAYTR